MTRKLGGWDYSGLVNFDDLESTVTAMGDDVRPFRPVGKCDWPLVQLWNIKDHHTGSGQTKEFRGHIGTLKCPYCHRTHTHGVSYDAESGFSNWGLARSYCGQDLYYQIQKGLDKLDV